MPGRRRPQSSLFESHRAQNLGTFRRADAPETLGGLTFCRYRRMSRAGLALQARDVVHGNAPAVGVAHAS